MALWRRWRGLRVAAVGASLPQIAVLVGTANPGSARVAVLAAIFWLLYLAGAIAEKLRGKARLQGLPATLALLAAALAGGSAVALFGGAGEGFALLAIGGVYGAAGGAFLNRERDLSSLLWAVGLAVGAVGLADLVSGDVLAIGWAAEAAVLAWLAVRTREVRFQLGAFAYLALATGHALTVDAPLAHLFVVRTHPAAGAVSLVAAALAAATAAFYARGRSGEDGAAGGILRRLEPFFAALRRGQPALREALLWVAAALATYAASLGILELAEVAGGYSAGAFDWGQLPVGALWALLAVGLLVFGARRGSEHLVYSGAVWLGATLAKAFAFDLGSVSEPAGLYAALAVGAIVLAGGYLYGRERDMTAVSVACALASGALLVIAVACLVGGELAGIDLQGAALLSTGACYGALAASVFRLRRDLSTLLWGTGLAIVLGAWPQLVTGTGLVVAWAATGAALAWLGLRTAEDRLQLGAAASILPALAWALIAEAPPSDLFVAGAHPGIGVPALAAVALATAMLAVCAPSVRQVRRSAAWVAGILAIEAVSLAILQVFEWAGTGSVHLEFQHGHTAVSAFWGTLGLVALYLGLARRSRSLRLTGFAIFGVSLAKIFLYDLSALSSITRALSFLAVGAVLLLGGFFYQRLSSQLEERHPAPG